MNKTLYIITGATGGIGSALYTRLVEKQPEDQYILVARRPIELKANTQEVLLDFATNIDVNPLKESIEKTIHEVSEVCMIISSGLINPISPVGTHTSAAIEENIRVNATSPTICIEMLVQLVKEHDKELKIIHLDSGAAYHPIHGWSLYCSTKSYMAMFLRVLACESTCKVVNFDPGVVDTNMQQTIRKSTVEEFPGVDNFVSYKENGILATPEAVAKQIYDRYIKEWSATELAEGMR